jgi:hypothetical protein
MTEKTGLLRRGLVEFVVIVLGVLVALGLESWWQGRQNRELAEEYVESLITEASAGVATVRSTSAVSGLKRRWLARANRIFEADLVGDSAAVFLEGVLQGSGIAVVPNLSDAVFEDLQSTGRLSLFGDPEVRRRIIRGYTGLEAMLERQERAGRNIDSRLHALASRYAPVGAMILVGPRIRVDPGAVTAAELRRSAASLAADPEFRGEMRAAFRALDHEDNLMAQLLFTLEEQLALLQGTAPATQASIRELIEADSAQFNRSGRTDSAGSR